MSLALKNIVLYNRFFFKKRVVEWNKSHINEKKSKSHALCVKKEALCTLKGQVSLASISVLFLALPAHAIPPM